MDVFEEQLAEEVRRHEHLYNTRLKSYKDARTASHSWREISQTLRAEESVCRRKWRYLRDKFAKAKRRVLKRRSEDPGGRKLVPALFTMLPWLDEHIKQRDTPSSTANASPPPPAEVAGSANDLVKGEILQHCSLPVVSTSFSLAESSQTSRQDVGVAHKRKRQTTTETSSAESLRDEDELFLLSLLPSMKRLTIKKRMEVRMKFQQVLYDAEFED